MYNRSRSLIEFDLAKVKNWFKTGDELWNLKQK
jgi:hypothetical protein